MTYDTLVFRTCGVNKCTNIVVWKFDPGESMTRDYPGSPAFWFADEGCDKTEKENVKWNIEGMPDTEIEVSHLETLSTSEDESNITDFIAVSSFDNREMDYYYDLDF